MDKLSALSRGMQLMLVGGVLLFIDTFFHWQEVSGTVFGIHFSGGLNAWHGFGGIVMCIALIVLLLWMAVRLTGVKIQLPISDTMLAAGLAALVFVCALAKNLNDDYSTKWSYIGIVLAGVVAVGAWFELQAAGGVDTLRSEMASMTSKEPPPEPPAGSGETSV
jgi:hypothetical protein